MNYYEILGVGPDATEHQIKEAYRREAMKWHPDRHEGAAAKGEATRRFKDLAEAYRTLRNAVERANYDRFLEQRLHQEYEARQQEQARQQRAQSEQARWDEARQKQAHANQAGSDSQDTKPGYEEDTTSSDEANRMFFEQMLDLAFELAARGFGETHIANALIALGCPASMANAVAVIAAKRGRSEGFDQPSKQPDAPAIVNFDDASWEELEPYYLAAIMGKTSGPRLSESRYKTIETIRKGRWDLCVGLGAICLVLIAVVGLLSSSTRFEIFWLLVGVGFLFSLVGLVAKSTFLGPDKKPFLTEYRRRYYSDAFRVQHLERKGSPASNDFNWSAFFMNYVWLGYRRLPGLAFLVLIIYSAINLTFIAVASGEYILWSYPVMLVVSGVVAHYGNRLYFNRIHSTIRSTIAGVSPRQAINELTKRGGPNPLGWIAPVMLGIVLSLPGFAIQNERTQEEARLVREAKAEAAARAAALAEAEAAAAQAASEARQRIAEQQAKVLAKAEYDRALRNIENQYPQLNPDSRYYNPNAMDWVVNRKRQYEESGNSPTVALQGAINDFGLALQANR